MGERSTIGGYQIVKRIGSGGMSAVYQAVDADGREVALKLLHPEVAADPASRERLRREVRMLQRVHGEYVAQILDAETEDYEVFIVTQLIDGPTLEADVRDSGRYERADLVELGEELAAALRSIHEVGVLHRDLKPSNVMMGADGPVLIDFGIAQLGDDLRMTRTGSLTHTPGWADPRVIRGASPDEKADWWALAAVLAYAATGTAPYKAETTPAVMHRVLSGEPRLPGLSSEVERAFRRALDPESSRRISFGELVETIASSPDDAVRARPSAGSAASGAAVAASPLVTGSSVDGSGCPVTGFGQDTLEEDLDDYGDDSDDTDWDAGDSGVDATQPIGLETGQVTAPFGVDRTRMQTQPGPTYDRGRDQLSTRPYDLGAHSYGPPGSEQMPEAFGPNEPTTAELPATSPSRTSVFDRPAAEPDFDPHTRELLPVGRHAQQGAQWDQAIAPFDPAAPQRLPDWFRPARKARLHVLLTGVIIAIFSLVWTVPAAIVFASLVVVVSMIGGASRDLKDRRVAHGGPYSGDVAGALIRLPLTLIGALARSAISLAVGGALAWATIAALEVFSLTQPELFEPIGLVVGMVVAWFISSNRNGREGARLLMEGIGPTPGYRLFWLAILLVVAMAAVIVVSQSGVNVI
ncbi:serine/threonine protein kinase [Trueperella sp.]|uniref:serine/threonine protein kinase n=1 Tax=Trueperella sp. TaxID=2699835 RepID=UPI0037369747